MHKRKKMENLGTSFANESKLFSDKKWEKEKTLQHLLP